MVRGGINHIQVPAKPTCSRDTSTGSLKTTHVTHSEQGGVVSEP